MIPDCMGHYDSERWECHFCSYYVKECKQATYCSVYSEDCSERRASPLNLLSLLLRRISTMTKNQE